MDCAYAVCVRAQSTRVHVLMDACARRRRIAESNRTVQQAQAAGCAGEAAKKYSSRCLKLRGEQRERRNFSVLGKSGFILLFFSPKEPFGCFGLFYCYFFIPFVFFHLSIWVAGAHAAWMSVGNETKGLVHLLKKIKEIEQKLS